MNTLSPALTSEPARTYYEFGRLQSMDQWWHWMLLSMVCFAIVGFIVLMYLRDCVEMAHGKRWLLLTLRVLAFVGLLVFFLELEKRSERKIVKNSRLTMLVDTSQSMALTDSEGESGAPGTRRIDRIIAELSSGTVLEQMRRRHDVTVYCFDQGERPREVASLAKLPSDDGPIIASSTPLSASSMREARILTMVAGAFAVIAIVVIAAHWLLGRWVTGAEGQSWALLLGVVILIVAVVTLAVSHLRNPQATMATIFGTGAAIAEELPADEPADAPDNVSAVTAETEPIDWSRRLEPRGAQTRLGDALRGLLDKERGGPIAGIVLFSDGRSNAGIEYDAAVDVALDAEIPVYTVGLGSDQTPVNVRIVDLEGPPRVYPNDRFTLTGYLQAAGLEGRSVEVELVSAPDDGGATDTETFEDERRVRLGPTGDILPVKFEVTPDQPGKRIYKLRISPPEEDRDGRDNEKSVSVQVVDRKNRVMLIAGGPTREFRFLRNQLYRDRDVTVDVWLQTGGSGASQEADNLLTAFPEDSQELFEFDSIVTFDPDWEQLSQQQFDLLERWVAEQAGGLIVVAGPIYMPKWTARGRGDSRFQTLKDLFPVTFYSRAASSLAASNVGSESAWPLRFTEEGAQTGFLWIDDTALLSEQAWASFEGVYGYYTVRGPKPGATVYTRFSDPQTAIDSELPVYMAGQFYGAGRVFYQGSGEMWRLRALDEKYFEQYYTKLIRAVSQGRLLRDSNRGVLLVDKQRCLMGDTVIVRASLTDVQFQPLKAAEVSATLVRPDEQREDFVLRQVKEAARDGMYAGQFTTRSEGDYRVELVLPGATDDVLLTRDVLVRVPDLEIERPQRNDALLTDIATRTGGAYYVGMDAMMGRQGAASLANVIVPQDQQTYLPGLPDRDFGQRLMAWLMGLICGVLCLEWLVRRLNRLA